MGEWVGEGLVALHRAEGGTLWVVPQKELGYVRSRADGGAEVQRIHADPARGTQYETIMVLETPQDVMDQIGTGLPARWL